MDVRDNPTWQQASAHSLSDTRPGELNSTAFVRRTAAHVAMWMAELGEGAAAEAILRHIDQAA